ncbi:hypothetical protein SAMD00019534_118190 [Acytostelium subglobosum LB1]|uniref:hypothetical protein n=1 Tax=Acytostelium subglobosum LB1 TaxID=1410327 RepID=UPI000644F0C4|nr:hypothetical protein SAMD00019534_118190 [Acytostelium subglobosum LB1]GAM28643.1 hypothetical protein SAMD00019534_118190 [Acytostelium subglobosum LB1]|eukprot:XP_012748421.1 hypothetical protein SAMD00019534_118190 [Acytostelium subglobosum LB1]
MSTLDSLSPLLLANILSYCTPVDKLVFALTSKRSWIKWQELGPSDKDIYTPRPSLVTSKLDQNQKQLFIPPNTKILELEGDNHQPIDPGTIPNSVTTLWYDINHPLPPGVIPSSVVNLEISSFFDHDLEQDSLPSSITDLKFCFYNRRLLPSVFPTSLTKLSIFRDDPTPMEVIFPLPPSITDFTLLSDINPMEWHSTIHALPSLTTLSVGRFTPAPNIGFVPNCVTTLDILSFDHNLTVGLLPHGLKTLNIKCEFNRRLCPGMLPPTLTHLSLGSHFNQKLLADGSLPQGLLHLDVSDTYDQTIAEDVLPTTLKSLIFGLPANERCNQLRLPSQLEQLRIGNCGVALVDIPKGIKYLSLKSKKLLSELKELPITLETLSLDCSMLNSLFKRLGQYPSLCHIEGRSDTFTENCLPMLPPNLRSVAVKLDNMSEQIVLPDSVQDIVVHLEHLPQDLRECIQVMKQNKTISSLMAAKRAFSIRNFRSHLLSGYHVRHNIFGGWTLLFFSHHEYTFISPVDWNK